MGGLRDELSEVAEETGAAQPLVGEPQCREERRRAEAGLRREERWRAEAGGAVDVGTIVESLGKSRWGISNLCCGLVPNSGRSGGA